jgi:hypothetical protein
MATFRIETPAYPKRAKSFPAALRTRSRSLSVRASLRGGRPRRALASFVRLIADVILPGGLYYLNAFM